tara:strand:- start:411 stop:1019 length:609 start_codon:yes stop_codon:yes gene_type:complete
MPKSIGMGGRIKHDKMTNYSILLIYCKTDKNKKFLDFTTTTNIRNYKYLIMKKKLTNPKYENLVLIKTINENGGLTNWVIEPLESLDANYFDTQKRMNEIASKYNIKTNIFDDDMVNVMKQELNKCSSETSEEDHKEIKETIDKEKDVLYECECGSKFKKSNLRHHLKTQKHIDFMKKKEQLNQENNNNEIPKLEVVNLCGA